MHLAVMVGKFVKQDVREWYPSTSGPIIAHHTDDSGDFDDSSGVDDADNDTDEHCHVVWAKAGRRVWGLCHVFEDTLYLTSDLMEYSTVPSNLSIPKLPDPDVAAISAPAKSSPKPG